MIGGFCTECDARVASFEGLDCCPACGTHSLPCPDDHQVTVSINWQELQVLVIWAENWQRQCRLGRTVYAIARRLQAQRPDRGPLTLAGQLGELAAQYPDAQVNDPELRQDIAEQTGQELGLVRPPKEAP